MGPAPQGHGKSWSGRPDSGYVQGRATAGLDRAAGLPADERLFPLSVEAYGEEMDVCKDEGRPIPLTQERLVLRPKLTSYGLGLWVTAWLSIGSLYTGVGLIIYEPDQIGYILLALVVGVALLALVVLTFFTRTVLDADGVHLHAYGRSRDVPWPTSRTSLFARVTFGKHLKSVDVHMVLPDGTAMPLLGLSWTGQWPPPLEAAAVIQCSRIWSWAVARGYTRETHEYIPLSGATWKVQQGLRESQERRFGLRWTA